MVGNVFTSGLRDSLPLASPRRSAALLLGGRQRRRQQPIEHLRDFRHTHFGLGFAHAEDDFITIQETALKLLLSGGEAL